MTGPSVDRCIARQRLEDSASFGALMVVRFVEEEEVDEKQVERTVNPIKKVPGNDDSEEGEALVVNQLKVLLRTGFAQEQRDYPASIEGGDGEQIEYE